MGQLRVAALLSLPMRLASPMMSFDHPDEVATEQRAGAGPGADPMATIELLAERVGPRRPTGSGERIAAEELRALLRRGGLDAELEPFGGYSTFGLPFGLTLVTAVAPALLPRRRRIVRSALAALAAGALVSEGSLVRTPLSDLLSRRRSQNCVATIEPSAGVERTLCLMAHYDSSRSGLMFHPRLVGLMGRWITLNSVLIMAAAIAEPLAGRSRVVARGLAVARAILAAGVGVLIERETRGVDVPGANDNASGTAVVAALAAELALEPLRTTRVVICLTGCEEAGTLGSEAFLNGRDTDGWLFLNVDNVGGSGTVRYLRREGVISHWDADPGLIAAAESVARANPDLRMAAEDRPAGLTYDSSRVLAGGGRALTLSVQDGFIPNLHLPTDTLANVDPDGVARTLAAARGIAAAVDAGAADGA